MILCSDCIMSVFYAVAELVSELILETRLAVVKRSVTKGFLPRWPALAALSAVAASQGPFDALAALPALAASGCR